jgi:hypothetical protein
LVSESITSDNGHQHALEDSDHLWLFISYPVDEKKRTKEKSCQSNAVIRAGAAERLLF